GGLHHPRARREGRRGDVPRRGGLRSRQPDPRGGDGAGGGQTVGPYDGGTPGSAAAPRLRHHASPSSTAIGSTQMTTIATTTPSRSSRPHPIGPTCAPASGKTRPQAPPPTTLKGANGG